MGLTITKSSGGENIPVFQKVLEVAQGGFTLTKTGLSGTVKKGTPVNFADATRLVVPFKCAVLQADAAVDATEYKVLKGHHLIVGDQLAVVVGGKNYAITAIVTTNAAYDAVTVATTLGVVLTAGAVLFKSTGTAGADTAALHVKPNGLLYEDTNVGDNEPVSVVIRGTVYSRRVANGIHAEVVKALPQVNFSSSF